MHYHYSGGGGSGGGGGGGGGVNGSSGGVDGSSGRPVSASCGLASGVGQRWWIFVDTKYFDNIWLLFGVLFSICVFVGIPKRDKYLAFYSCYKKNKYTNKKWSFCSVYPCISPKKSPFLQNKYTKDSWKVNDLCTEENPSFVYLRSHVLGQRNHSLIHSFTYLFLL